jgi:hypothetical protein
MEKYTVTATSDYARDQINVMARCRQQHIWSETELIGVSERGYWRLEEFFKKHKKSDGWRITINAGPYHPRLIGYYVG